MSSSELVNCPQCGEPARVPETLYGQAVRCPACKTMYLAPRPDGQGGWTAARPVRDATAVGYDPDRRDKAFNPFVPGLALVLIGVVGFLVNLFSMMTVMNDPAGLEVSIRSALEPGLGDAVKEGKMNADEAKQMLDTLPKKVVDVMRTALPVFVLLSALMAAGGLSMTLRRFYPLALIGAFATFLNLGNLCCCVGAPVGIWSLVVLFNPDTRALFRRPAPVPPS